MGESSAISKIAGWAISLIGLSVWYKFYGIYGWDTYLWIGAVMLLLVGTYIIGSVFDLGFIDAFGASSFFIGLMMVVLQPWYSVLFFAFTVIVIIAKIGGI